MISEGGWQVIMGLSESEPIAATIVDDGRTVRFTVGPDDDFGPLDVFPTVLDEKDIQESCSVAAKMAEAGLKLDLPNDTIHIKCSVDGASFTMTLLHLDRCHENHHLIEAAKS